MNPAMGLLSKASRKRLESARTVKVVAQQVASALRCALTDASRPPAPAQRGVLRVPMEHQYLLQLAPTRLRLSNAVSTTAHARILAHARTDTHTRTHARTHTHTHTHSQAGTCTRRG
jgi:hypothetical protein